ncbi:MAG: GNAT family N-acetyltransferase [Gammaproteobacteria bacterium]|nr:GNAT family N-acetyltransferase [Gammaproteobacteria bacterium]
MIREIRAADRAQWDPLWRGYLSFYRTELPAGVTDVLWDRFFDAAEPLNGLVAEQDGKLLGFVHYVFHRSTWEVENVCYLEDLFTAPEARGRGVGRALIGAVYDKARLAKSKRVYWMTHETNGRAMMLYDQVADKPGFLQYCKAL